MDYLPLFVDVRARLVVVIGGGVVALRKIDHLLKAHAKVRVVAPQLCPELINYLADARIEHVAQQFQPAQLHGALLVIGATDDDTVNEAVAVAARERGLLVNVVDDAERSSCIFPAIVDRSPLIVAVGTAGQSPSLARRVRSQIEALLPERLGTLVEFAGRWREQVAAALPSLSERLRFWDGFLASTTASQLLAGQTAGADQAMQLAVQEARTAAGTQRGEVYLIGVGPGDPDLLTLRAQQLLQQADVLLHDRLVPTVILDRARRDALRVNVGKTPGRHEHTQAAINQLMVDHARRGLRVARVKGGDPFVFGRGGEELQVLREAGIPAIVVPGITASLGAAASAGIPLTQRGLSQVITLVTGTGADAASLNWAALAQAKHTLVFYMSASQLDTIAARLLEHGLPPQHPAVLLERATLPDERVIVTSLGQLLQAAATAQLRSPTLLLVGEVGALAQARNWLGSSN